MRIPFLSLLLFFSYALFCSESAFGQKKFAKKIVEQLCSEEFAGRGYVDGGDSLAAEFLAAELKKFGAKPLTGAGYFQHFEIMVNRFPGDMKIEQSGQSLRPGIDFVVAPGSAGFQGVLSSFRVVHKTNLLPQVRELSKNWPPLNTTLVIDAGGVSNPDSLGLLRELCSAYAQRGPVIWLETEKFTWGVSQTQYRYPVLRIKTEKFDYHDPLEVSIDASLGRHKTKNVIGKIKGTRPWKKPLVLSAHYDHLGKMGRQTYFPGANDNASGVAMLLSLAKHYAKDPPKRTIIFMFFAAEEVGILGSKYYVEHPLFKLKRIKFLLNCDLLGTGEEGITVVNGSVFKKEFDKLVSINKENKFIKKIKVRGRAANSDHYWFTVEGVPSFFIYTMGGIKAYHDIYDKAETLPLTEFNYVRKLFIEFLSKI